jgi:hypothetical protein
MDFQALGALENIIGYHTRVLKRWPDDQKDGDYMVATHHLENYKEMAINKITTKSNEELHQFLYSIYYDFFTKTYSKTPKEVAEAYVVRVQGCERVSGSGRFWPCGKEGEPAALQYGYEVTIMDSKGWTNLVRRWDGDDCTIIATTEMSKVERSPMETLALAIAQYSVRVSEKKSRYYRTDY